MTKFVFFAMFLVLATFVYATPYGGQPQHHGSDHGVLPHGAHVPSVGHDGHGQFVGGHGPHGGHAPHGGHGQSGIHGQHGHGHH